MASAWVALPLSTEYFIMLGKYSGEITTEVKYCVKGLIAATITQIIIPEIKPCK